MVLRSKLEVTPGFCIFWAFLILTLPIELLLASASAALFHELCHGLAVKLTGGNILAMTLGAGGMEMAVSEMSPGRELVCALAGPAGSLLLACLPLPKLALCGLIQGLFNLLPLMPMDGGRALGILLELTVPRYRGQIERIVEGLVCGLLLIGAWRLGTGALLLWMAFVYRKFPCKPWGKRVQ